MNAAQKHAFDQVLAILKDSQPVAFSLYIAKTVNNPKVAILLSQLVYWSRTSTRIGETAGFIYKTYKEWAEETGLSRHELDVARRRARTMNFIEELRTGKPATLWYQLNLPKLMQALDVCRKNPLGISLTFDFMQSEPQRMRDVLGPTTGYHTALSSITGSVTAGLLLSRLLQLQKLSIDSNREYVSVTADKWCDDLGLNRRALENARKRLRDQGLIEEIDWRANGARRIMTQVQSQTLLNRLRAYSQAASKEIARQVVQGTRRLAPPAIPSAAQVAGQLSLSMPEIVPSAIQERSREAGAAARPVDNLEKETGDNVRNRQQDCRFRTVKNAGFVHTPNIEYDYSYHHNPRTSPRTSEDHLPAQGDVVVDEKSNPEAFENPAAGWQGVPQGFECPADASEWRQAGKFNGGSYRPTHSSEKSLKTAAFASDEIPDDAASFTSGGRPRQLHDAVDDDLIWPSVIAPAMQDSARRLLAPLDGLKVRQTVLDELAGRARQTAIGNVLGYLRQLSFAVQRGAFVAEVAHTEVRRRQGQAHVAASAEAARAAMALPTVMPALTAQDRAQGRAALAQLKAQLALGAGRRL